jgi:hypothetical protein
MPRHAWLQAFGVVEVFHRGRLASTLRGADAEDFKHEASDERSADAQQLMARVSGNYKPPRWP